MSDPFTVSPDGAAPPGVSSDHEGLPIASHEDFFVLPPPEIGQLVSASTDLVKGAREKPAWVRYGATALGLAVGLGGCGTILSTWGSVADGRITWPQIVVPLVAGLIGLAFGYFSTSFAHRCTYVGMDGYADFYCSGDRANISVSAVCPFEKTAALYSGETKVFVNGGYSRTKFNFDLERADRPHTGPSLSGEYKEGEPKKPFAYHAGRAVELAYTQYLLRKLPELLAARGAIEFPIKFAFGGVQSIALMPGVIEMRTKQGNFRCGPENLESVVIENGRLVFRRKDAKQSFFSSTGIFEVDYASLANAKLFFLLLDQLVGYRFR